MRFHVISFLRSFRERHFVRTRSNRKIVLTFAPERLPFRFSGVTVTVDTNSFDHLLGGDRRFHEIPTRRVSAEPRPLSRWRLDVRYSARLHNARRGRLDATHELKTRYVDVNWARGIREAKILVSNKTY